MGVKKKFVIHAHFYQPPRHNPWTGEVVEETNSLHSSYNQIITDQCYGPLALARVRHRDDFFSTYSFLSFNFGPTLLKYIEERYPKLYISIINSDRISEKIFGYPSAIAQVYNHAIMPHLSLREKKLYVRWGIESFKRTFHRQPEGMWLAETACDSETLEVLVHCGIKFTILADHQIKEAWSINDANKKLESVKSGVYLWSSKEDPQKKLTIFVYNSQLSKYFFREIYNIEKFLIRVKNTFEERNFLMIASDGENYGHHIKNGDEYLVRFIEKIKASKDIELSNLSTIYHTLQPEYEVNIKENTSWSCPHGIERWSNECGCRINQNAVYQKWRKTLKKASEIICELSHRTYHSNATGFISNPMLALENYITLYENPQPHQIMLFLEKNSLSGINHAQASTILKLMKMEVASSFTKTSCGFFFDDITGSEAKNNIRNILYVLKTAVENQFGNIKVFNEVVDMLKKEKSNFIIDVDEMIDGMIKESETSLMRYICENVYLHHLGFHINFIPSHLRIKINTYPNSLYIINACDIHTLASETFQLKIIEEKSVVLMKIKREKSEEEKIFTLNDLSAKTTSLIRILTSHKPQDQNAKRFFYLLSNSTMANDIIYSYINLLKSGIAHTLPFAYEIALTMITLSKNYSKLDELKSAIKGSALECVMWKILLYMEKI
ncbi:MAG: DUF3536 domain-containing protein [Elusimicrobiales bacterium]